MRHNNPEESVGPLSEAEFHSKVTCSDMCGFQVEVEVIHSVTPDGELKDLKVLEILRDGGRRPCRILKESEMSTEWRRRLTRYQRILLQLREEN